MADFHDRRSGGAVYTFRPVGMDAFDPHKNAPRPGDPVRRSMKHGLGLKNAPKPFMYVEHADTGEFHGMVLRNSLIRRTKANPEGKD